jgi:hypothetical protein
MIDYKYKILIDNLYSAGLSLGFILVSHYFLKLAKKKYPNSVEIIGFVTKALEILWVLLFIIALYNMMDVYFLL